MNLRVVNLATEIPDLDEARQQALNAEPGRMDIYVDGSFDAGSGKGGWAFVVMSDEETLATGSGRIDGATNNALELVAALEAAKWASDQAKSYAITIWSDSAYVVEGSNYWLPIWKNNGWRRYNPNSRARNRGIPDQDLWKLLDRQLLKNKLLTIAWCKGHQGNIGNELADQLAAAVYRR